MSDIDYARLVVNGKVTESSLMSMLGNDHGRLVRVKRAVMEERIRRGGGGGGMRGKRGLEPETFPGGEEQFGGGKRRCSRME